MQAICFSLTKWIIFNEIKAVFPFTKHFFLLQSIAYFRSIWKQFIAFIYHSSFSAKMRAVFLEKNLDRSFLFYDFYLSKKCSFDLMETVNYFLYSSSFSSEVETSYLVEVRKFIFDGNFVYT